MSSALFSYCVDTSALIDGVERYYPIASFPALWDRIDDLVQAGRFFLSEEVWEEVKSKDEKAKRWVEPRLPEIVVPTDAAVALAVKAILDPYELMVKNMKGRNRADPFVIAVAQQRGAVVLTGEANDGSENRPKIPYVCNRLGVPCMRLVDLITNEGWRF